MKSIIQLSIYTDGSSKQLGNIRFGGWSFIITEDGVRKHSDSGGSIGATNQQMELTAAIKACEYIAQRRADGQQIVIYSDSAYLTNCYLQGWWQNWMRNGWENSKGESVANQDLWWRLIPFFKNKNFMFRKVLGHSDNYYNNLCDMEAQREADKLKLNWRGTENYEKQE